MISDNTLHPNTYEVSKVTELVPAGVIKLTMKQKPHDEKRDNVPLRICDYYDENGDSLVELPKPTDPDPLAPTSTIHWCFVNDEGELEYMENADEPMSEELHLRKASYFYAEFSDDYDGTYVWKIAIKDGKDGDPDDKYSDEREEQLVNYINLTDFQDGSCVLKPSRIKDLIGNTFILSVSDENGGHYSEIEMEVMA